MTENAKLPATTGGDDYKKSLVGLPKATRAAMLLMSVGEQDAAEVLKHMGHKEVQQVGTAMSVMPNVRQEQIAGVVKLFLEEVSGQSSMGAGADEYIRNMLNRALGEDKAGALIDRITMGGSTSGLDTLKWMEPRAVAEIIRNEHPQIQTIVLAYLDPDQAGDILAHFTDKVRLDIVMRVAALESVQPAALQELNAILEKQFSGSAGGQAQALGGVKTAAEIMNFLESSIEAEIMGGIKDVDDDLATQITDLMFVFADLVEVDDRGIQALLREVSTDSLKLALRGADDDLSEKLLGNLSKRAADILKDDMEAMGPVKISEVEQAQKEILGIAKRMSEAGEIMLGGAGAEAML